MAFEYYRSVVGFSTGGQYAAIVQHWGVDSPTGDGPFARAKALVTALKAPVAGDSFLDKLTDCMSDSCFISSLRAAKISPGPGNIYAEVFAPATWPGDVAGDIDAAQVAGCVIWLTAGNAGLNGRTFVPCVSQVSLDNGRFITAYKTALSVWVGVVLPGIQSTVGTFLPMLKHGSPPSFNQIVHGALSLTPGTQRRRLVPV